MREAIVAITQTEARSAAERAQEQGADQRGVALAAMRAARDGIMAPDASEAFAAAIAVLWALYPHDEALRQETRAIGDRNKVMSALTSGVPVDFDALEMTPLPADALGLIALWQEAGARA